MEQFISSIGQDSHRFVDISKCEAPDKSAKEAFSTDLILAGVTIPGTPRLEGNSDADVVFHALTNAISGISGVNVLGRIADDMCASGITDSAKYLEYAIGTLTNEEIVHISFSIECLRPKLAPYILEMRKSIARIVGIDEKFVCITATTGEGLTDFGKGLGIQTFCILTAKRCI